MNSHLRNTVCKLFCNTAVVLITVVANSQSLLANEILKFSQLPMLDTHMVDDSGLVRGFHGHDELSTAWSQFKTQKDGTRMFDGYSGQLMADDFADRLNSPVVHLRWWGSYLNGPLQGVDKFLISFSADVPTATGSHPGTTLLNQVVTRGPLAPGSGTFAEQQVSPLSVDGPIYQYDAQLNLGQEFHQQPDTVYWLTIAALVDTTATNPLTNPSVIRWGWHNRDYTIQDSLASVSPTVAPGENIDGILKPPTSTSVWHFQDDAVSGSLRILPGPQGHGFTTRDVEQTGFSPQQYQGLVDGPLDIGGFSKDLAFQLYAVPEPTSIALLLFGAVGLLAVVRGPRGGEPQVCVNRSSCVTRVGVIAVNALLLCGIACSDAFAIPGDYNANSFGDAADYTVWRDALGQSTVLPNEAATPGVVDFADYNVWKTNFVVPALSPSQPAGGPTLSVTSLPPSPNGNLRWSVNITPDAALFSNMPGQGVGGSVAAEIGIEVLGTSLVSASKNATNFDFDNPGDSPFAFGDPPAVGVTILGNQVFAALGSDPFATSSAKQMLIIETAGSAKTKIMWSGVYGPNGDRGRTAQAGLNFDVLPGMVMSVPEPASLVLICIGFVAFVGYTHRRLAIVS